MWFRKKKKELTDEQIEKVAFDIFEGCEVRTSGAHTYVIYAGIVVAHLKRGAKVKVLFSMDCPGQAAAQFMHAIAQHTEIEPDKERFMISTHDRRLLLGESAVAYHASIMTGEPIVARDDMN
jgi:hypothetical protein